MSDNDYTEQSPAETTEHPLSDCTDEPINDDPAYISYMRAKGIMERRFPDTSAGEISLWLQNKELTAFSDESIDAAAVNFAQNFDTAWIDFSLNGGILPTHHDLLLQCYFSKNDLESFEPKTRWRPYGYVVELAKTYCLENSHIDAIIRRDWEICLIYDDHTPRYYAEDFAQATDQNIQEHYYPSYWIDEIIRTDLGPYWAELTKGCRHD